MAKNGIPTLESFADYREAASKLNNLRNRLRGEEETLADLQRQFQAEVDGRSAEGEAVEAAARRLLAGEDPGVDGDLLKNLQSRITETRRQIGITRRAVGMAKERVDEVRDGRAAEVSRKYRREHEKRVARIGQALRELSAAIGDQSALLYQLREHGLWDELQLPPMSFPGIGDAKQFDSPAYRWFEAAQAAGFDTGHAS